MYEVRLSNLAKEDLRRIYYYGAERFCQQQADHYFYAFFSMFEQIANNPFLYQSVDHIRPGYRRCLCGVDSIYYRIDGNTVDIMAILGSQDVQPWLP